MTLHPLKTRFTIMNNKRIEMKRLVLSIERNLPNVAAAGPDLRALRVLLNLQLVEASLLRPHFFKPAGSD
jgi:hypothetical protein